jgi:hypothetical protein
MFVRVNGRKVKGKKTGMHLTLQSLIVHFNTSEYKNK